MCAEYSHLFWSCAEKRLVWGVDVGTNQLPAAGQSPVQFGVQPRSLSPRSLCIGVVLWSVFLQEKTWSSWRDISRLIFVCLVCAGAVPVASSLEVKCDSLYVCSFSFFSFCLSKTVLVLNLVVLNSFLFFWYFLIFYFFEVKFVIMLYHFLRLVWVRIGFGYWELGVSVELTAFESFGSALRVWLCNCEFHVCGLFQVFYSSRITCNLILVT